MSIGSDILLDPIYAAMADTATVTPVGHASTEIVAIDKTSGVVVGGQIDTPSLLPAVIMRRSDMAAAYDGAGFTAEQMVNQPLTINGVDWLVDYSTPAPGMRGEADGEVLFVLKVA